MDAVGTEELSEASMDKLKDLELKEHYEASMVLSGAGDALGYKNGDWEFCHSGKRIHEELKKLGGIENVTVTLPQWMVSDDTVMHLATAEALVEWGDDTDKEQLYHKLAYHYKHCMTDMAGRAPGTSSSRGCFLLRPNTPQGYCIPFDTRASGCGAAMRAMCIGLRFPRPEELSDLIAVSVESGRMTHHFPTGYLGSLASALFTTYAIQGHPVQEWGKGLMDVLPKALNYVKSQGRDVEENVKDWSYFGDAWTKYLHIRGIQDGKAKPVFPDKYGVEERDETYESWSFSGWGGGSGHDAPMIAYDALLGAGNNWKELCHSLFGAVLQKMAQDEADLIVVAPLWPTQPWFPSLLHAAVGPAALSTRDSAIGTQSAMTTSPPQIEDVCFSFIRTGIKSQGLSDSAAIIIINSWRTSTKKQYWGHLQKWLLFSNKRQINPLDPPVTLVILTF